VTKKSAVTAVHKLELSKLDPRKVQQELMGDDLDLEKLVVYLKSKIKFDAAEQVIDVQISRSIEQASTVVVSLNDYHRTVLNSGLLNAKLDIEIDGLWWRLVKVERQAGQSQLDLTFEQREIAVLRSYPPKGAPHNGVKFAHRSKTTRAEFILNLIREVKEFHIPVVIPKLHKVQAIEKSSDNPNPEQTFGVTATSGIAPKINQVTESHLNPRMNIPSVSEQFNGITVKGAVADKEQIRNANIIITVGHQMNMPRQVIVCAIMTATQESTLHNLSGGDLDSVGLFQQRASWGSYADRHDPVTSSRMFYNSVIKTYRSNPNAPYWQICADTQRPREDLRQEYNRWRLESERTVTAYGLTGGADNNPADMNLQDRSSWGSSEVAASDYVFYRGIPTEKNKVWKREDNWACIQRLASEVQWQAFFISGVFYLISEADLLKTQPIMIVDETSQGVEGIGFDYDIGKKSATVSIPMRVGLWICPPGGVVALQHMGPVSGRWIVSDFSRSLFDSKADVSLKKPEPILPEPFQGDVPPKDVPTWAQGSGGKVQSFDPSIDTSSGPLASAASNAGKLVKNPHWHDDNGRGRDQLMKVALGGMLNGAEGPVNLDPRVPGIILYLINQGLTIGTYAWCEDHSDDGLHGHTGGFAVDISSINGHAISGNDYGLRDLVIEVDKMLNAITGLLAPRQIITGGFDNHPDFEISQYTRPNPGYYGATTMSQHENHIHVGY
jgi:hypothetical protein